MARKVRRQRDKKEWALWLDTIQDMLDSGEFESSRDFLQGVYDWVEKNHHITERQIEAIENQTSDEDLEFYYAYDAYGEQW